MTSVEDNKHLVRRFYAEVIGMGDASSVDELVAADYVDHNAEDAGRGSGVVRRHMEGIRTTFPDFSIRIEQILADGEFVITRVAGSGTHLGEWMGIEPSGRTVRVKGINIERVKDGRIVEHWGEADTVGMLIQMGVDPVGGRARE